MRFWAISMMALSCLGCGSETDPGDAGRDAGGGMDGAIGADSGAGCSTDSECDDGQFCTGPEACDPSDPGADARGCVPAASPCAVGEVCLEATDACSSDCADEDGDGRGAASCGGDDCDDTDANRFPGNTETCDADDHDEDCDPTTFGYVDADMDGEPDAECCNFANDGTPSCGMDCDDSNPGINTTAVEICDVATPAVDENCDGIANPDPPCTCLMGQSRSCAGVMGRCADGTQDCIAGAWSECSIAPVAELCNGLDDNCNGGVDEDFGTLGMPCDGTDTDMCNEGVFACNGAGGVSCDDTTGDSVEVCNAMDDDCDGSTDEGNPDGGAACGETTGECRAGTETCDPSTGMIECVGGVEPESMEVCDSRDHDCDGDDYNGFACGPPGTSAECTVPVCRVLGTSERVQGSRPCVAGTCTYGGCAATEELCNYCDDSSGMGTAGGWAEDRGDAITMITDPFTCSSLTLSGSATCGFFLRTHDVAAPNSVGAVRFTGTNHTLGWGTYTFEAEVRAVGRVGGAPGRGWALFVRRYGEGSGHLGAADDYGVPQNRNGYAMRWEFRGSGDDAVRAYALNNGAATEAFRVSSSVRPNFNNGGDSVTQYMKIEITPDDPLTAGNELVVCGYFGPSTSSYSEVDFDPRTGGFIGCCRGSRCRHQFQVGERVIAGAASANGATSSEQTDVYISLASTEIRRLEACF